MTMMALASLTYSLVVFLFLVSFAKGMCRTQPVSFPAFRSEFGGSRTTTVKVDGQYFTKLEARLSAILLLWVEVAGAKVLGKVRDSRAHRCFALYEYTYYA